MKKQYQPLFDYLESETGVAIEAQKASSYPAVFQALKGGRGDLADASPTLAVVGDDENVTDVVGIRVAYGSAKYFSLLSTTTDSGVSKLFGPQRRRPSRSPTSYRPAVRCSRSTC